MSLLLTDVFAFVQRTDGLTPYDGMPNVEIDTVSTTQAVLGILLGIAGISFAILCLVFNLYFRTKRYMYDL